MSKLKKVLFALTISTVCHAKVSEEWMTILVHGTVGFQANFSFKTINLAKQDAIEGSDYEKNVLAIREHPYLFALQPIQKMGLHPVQKGTDLNASYAFATLFEKVQRLCNTEQKNIFYTFGWSGLISEKRRLAEARCFYISLREKIAQCQKEGKRCKIRLIGYSHGATMLLNLADIRSDEFPQDTFVIDETYLIGIPVTSIAHRQIASPIFRKIYNIYSRGDKVQRLDIFSRCDYFTHREFKGVLPAGLTQIEMRFNAHLRRRGCYCLPPRMRGIINQSPGHIELWFFGWAPSSYRKNLSMYPMPGAVFIPHLVCAAEKGGCSHVVVDIRADQCTTCIRSRDGEVRATMPFFTKEEYADLINEALIFDPCNETYRDSYAALAASIDAGAYR